jgi:hypothetical protein
MLLSITNSSSTSTFTVMDPSGYSGVSIKVAPSATETKSISSDTYSRMAAMLDAAVTDSKITYTITDDSSSDVESAKIRTGVASPITVLATDEVVCTNLTVAGAVAVTLPAALPIGKVVEIYDTKGDAGTNTVTVTPTGGTINGAATATITVNYGGMRLVKVAANTWEKHPGTTSTVSGLNGGNSAVVADSQVLGGNLVVHTISVPDAATADYDVVLTNKTEILDVVVQKRAGAGAASNTITVKSGTNAITAALDLNVADQALVRAAALNDANSTIAAAGTLRVSAVKSGGNAACLVTVIGIRRT